MLSRPMVGILLVLTMAVGHFFATPEEIEKQFMGAQKQLATGDFEGAIRNYERVLAFRSNPLIRTEAVTVEIEEQAIPVKVAARVQLGHTYRALAGERVAWADSVRALGQEEQARIWHREAMEALIHAAQWLEQVSGDTTVDRALRALAGYQIVEAWFGAKRYAEVVHAAQRLVERFPENEYADDALYTMGWAYFHMEEADTLSQAEGYEEALRTYTTLLERFPKSPYADRSRFQIGECRLRRGETEVAKTWFRDLVDRYDFARYSPKERSQMELERFQSVEGSTIRELVAKAQLRIGDALAEEDSVESALAAYRTVITRYPQEEELVQRAYVQMARLREEREGVDAGITAYRDAMENTSDRLFQGKMQVEILRLLFDHGRYGEAAKEYTFYLKAFRDVMEEVGLTADEAGYRMAECYWEKGLFQRSRGQADSAQVSFEQALALYDSVASRHADTYLMPDLRFGQGVALQALGRTEEALNIYATLVEQFPKHAQAGAARLQMARMHYDAGAYEEATGAYEELIHTSVDSALLDPARLELAVVYRESGQTGKAIEVLSQIPLTSSELGKARIQMGELYVRGGRYEDAHWCVEEVLDRVGDSQVQGDLYYELGMVAYAQGAYGEAIGHLDRALSSTLDPDLALSARLTRALAHYHWGSGREDYARAMEELVDLVQESMPDAMRRPAYRALGLSMIYLGREEEALSYYRRWVDEAQGEVERSFFQLALVQVLYDMGRMEEAIRWAQSIDPVDPSARGEVRLLLGNAYLKQQEYEQVVHLFSEVPEAEQREGMAFGLGVAQFNLGGYEEAIGTFERFGERFPRSADEVHARYYIAHSYQALSEYRRAAEAFRHVAEAFPDGPYAEEALFLRAENLYNSRTFSDALKGYEEVLRRFPDGAYAPRAQYALAWCALDLEQEEAALRAFRDLLDQYPDSDLAPKAGLTLGDYYYNLQDYEQAKTAYTALIERYPGRPETAQARRLLDDLWEIQADRDYQGVMALFDAGKYQETIEGFEHILRTYPGTLSDIAARCNMAVAYEHLREWKQAIVVYDQVIDRAGDDPRYADVRAFAEEHRKWIVESRL